MFTSVRFRRFKRFSSENILLHEKGVTFIAGGNNSGKSTILQGLAIWEFCRAVIEAERGLEAFLPASKHSGLGISYDEFSPINIPSLRHLWTNLRPQKGSGDPDGYTLGIQCTWIRDGTEKELEMGLALANDRLFIKTTHSNLVEADTIPRVAYLPAFAGIVSHESRVTGAIRRRRIGEGLAGAVLRNIILDLHTGNSHKRASLRQGKSKLADADLRTLRESDPWELLQQTLRTTFGAELIVAPFREEYHSYIKVDVAKGEVKGYKLTRHAGYRNRDLMVEGGGFLQWLSVYTLATNPDVDVLLLDEPDAHLHYSLQQVLIEKLDELTSKIGKQVLIATHSTEILRQTRPDRIIEVSSSRPPRFLREEHQKIGLLAGLGTEYAPRIDAVKSRRRLMFVESDSDFRVLQKLTQKLGKVWPDSWVEWVNKSGHKERKHIFIAFQEELTDLVVLSIRDRDDAPLNSVGDQLEDKGIDRCPSGFHCRIWRRRNIESYLIWPQAIASVTGMTLEDVEKILRERHGIAVGGTFVNRNPPDTLCQVDGKEILNSFGADPMKVVDALPTDKIPEDIKTIVSELINLGNATA
jgi:predicted ATPase